MHLVFVVSTNEQFLQSSFVVRCSLDHFASHHSNLDADKFVALLVVAVVVLEVPEQLVVLPAAVAISSLRERQERRQIAVVAVAAVAVADTSSLVRGFAVVGHIECVASE